MRTLYSSKFSTAIAGLTILSASSCSTDIPTVNVGIDDDYYIYRMQKLSLQPALTGEKYRWSLAESNGEQILLSQSKDYIFLAEKEGLYHLKFEILDPDTPYEFEFDINVLHEDVEYSPYISKVYEYCPAPGQFINEMPRYEEGDTYNEILQKAEEAISGTNDTMISLGGYGGYVTFGFDHTIVNIEDEYDFRIWGNAFYELLQPDKKGGSAEPGIVMVSYDENCNGLPDDKWYELRGSEYDNPSGIHNYSITYNRPEEGRTPVADDDNSLSDIYYISWTDNQGNSGFMPKNIFHNNDYYPKWINDDCLTFSGSLLPANATDISGMGTYYILYSFDYGYVDNHPNDYADLNSFNINDAVDENGNHVKLPGADFIRVYTGLNQYCGWLGETSTEICRAQDLHIQPLNNYLPNPLE